MCSFLLHYVCCVFQTFEDLKVGTDHFADKLKPRISQVGYHCVHVRSWIIQTYVLSMVRSG